MYDGNIDALIADITRLDIKHSIETQTPNPPNIIHNAILLSGSTSKVMEEIKSAILNGMGQDGIQRLKTDIVDIVVDLVRLSSTLEMDFSREWNKRLNELDLQYKKQVPKSKSKIII